MGCAFCFVRSLFFRLSRLFLLLSLPRFLPLGAKIGAVGAVGSSLPFWPLLVCFRFVGPAFSRPFGG